jgi:hypothetical protein
MSFFKWFLKDSTPIKEIEMSQKPKDEKEELKQKLAQTERELAEFRDKEALEKAETRKDERTKQLQELYKNEPLYKVRITTKSGKHFTTQVFEPSVKAYVRPDYYRSYSSNSTHAQTYTYTVQDDVHLSKDAAILFMEGVRNYSDRFVIGNTHILKDAVETLELIEVKKNGNNNRK